MHINFKRILRTQLTKIAPMYGLDDILFPSFHKRYGYRNPISASDAVYALNALLDGGAGWLKRLETGSGREDEFDSNVGYVAAPGVGVGLKIGSSGLRVRPDDLARVTANIKRTEKRNNEEELSTNEDSIKKRNALWMENFYIAYDALDK